VRREKCRLIFQGGRNKEPFDRARLNQGRSRERKIAEEKRKQGSSKTLRYEKVDVTGKSS
jgi:hypothetical protein